jgi:arabinose-5-phosphate isomerase
VSSAELDLVAIGSMVVDRLHRTPRIVGPDEKGALRPLKGGASVQTFVGGVILNQLGWAAALGLQTGIFGKQADDEDGRFLRSAMERSGIEHQLVLDGSASSVAQVFVDDAGERAIYFSPAASAETTAEHVRRHHAAFLRRGRRFSTEVHQLPLAAVLAALDLAREARIPTVVDLDVPPSAAVPELGDEAELRAVLERADLLKPSKRAAGELEPGAGRDTLELARRIRKRFAVTAVVVTDGEGGCAVAGREFEGCVEAHPVKAVDATGAGDAFLGGLLAGLHSGLGWREAAQLGNASGAACVEQLGAFPDDAARVRARVLELYKGPAPPLQPLPLPKVSASTHHEALGTFDVALEELASLRRRLEPSGFDAALTLIREALAAGGRVHLTGVGKPEHVARYGASLMASTGTPATFLDATEAVHGSAGQIRSGDVAIVFSNSGETAEIRAAVEVVKRLGARIVAVTGAVSSWLGRSAEVTLDAGVAREGGGLGLAPRASVVAEVLMIAALAAALEKASGFTRADYHARHPKGILGVRSAPG